MVGDELDIPPTVGDDDRVELLGQRNRATIDACFKKVGEKRPN